MPAERAKKWPEQWLAQGRAEGRHDGLREAVRLQLQIKFGSLDAGYLERLDAADEAQLVEWARRVLDADSLSAVLEA